ncbi:Amino acid permease 3 [Dichanthelium oligosanthes]|uniref:Amino acid permease 3 n=1 Tax=Dichanthelium oligosanthes TaxID=888268 RepID=A0A1E5UZE5_9POAL|nr:Amino acid permease 3 [Dichanthelium oligosanthes]
MSHTLSVAPLHGRGLELKLGAAGDHVQNLTETEAPKPLVDDDGRPLRTGTLWTASAHIITAVIGSGVLSLAWGVAQLGWAAGPVVMVLFAAVIYYTSTLLAECYRSGDPVFGPRNRTYIDAVRATLGDSKERLCGAIQLSNLFGIGIGVSIAASVSMKAIRRAGCFHYRGHEDRCHASTSPYIAIFGVMQIVFSQIPDLDKIWWLSIVAAIMSFSYSTIGISLGVAEIIANGGARGSLAGVIGAGAKVTLMQKVWRSLQAFGNIAFAYGFSIILLEIQARHLSSHLCQDTIKSPPPSEAKVMKKATAVSVAVTTVIYLLCGCVGYAAFGSAAPDNMLTGFGFYEPFWLLDVANAFVVVHLVGTYQVMSQPVFAYVERRAAAAWPGSALVREREVRVGRAAMALSVSPIRLAWRTAYVFVTTAVAMLLPFFGSVVGFIGAVSFWPLTVYFPVEMYIAQHRVARGSTRWLLLHALSAGCLVVSIAAAAGSIAGVVEELKAHNPFCWSC